MADLCDSLVAEVEQTRSRVPPLTLVSFLYSSLLVIILYKNLTPIHLTSCNSVFITKHAPKTLTKITFLPIALPHKPPQPLTHHCTFTAQFVCLTVTFNTQPVIFLVFTLYYYLWPQSSQIYFSFSPKMIKNKLIQKSVRKAAVLLEHKIYLWPLKQVTAYSAAFSQIRRG